MNILGIHNSGLLSSAALIQDGRITAAIPEERLDRKKMSRGFPSRALEFCLESADLSFEDIDLVAVGWNPGINVLSRYRGGFAERVRYSGEWLYSVPNHLSDYVSWPDSGATEQVFQTGGDALRIKYVSHHDAHAALAYYTSPFDASAILTVDAYGERHSTTWKEATADGIQTYQTLDFPQSVGSLYAAFTEHLGFRPFHDEWKVMGLSAYGDPGRFREAFAALVSTEVNPFELDLTCFNHFSFDTDGLLSEKGRSLFCERRRRDDPIESVHQDLAAALQEITEQVLLRCVNDLHGMKPSCNVCLSGGAIMNSVFNGKVRSKGPFDRVHIPFSPDDCGNSIGAALWAYHRENPSADRLSYPVMPYLGRAWSNEEVEAALKTARLAFRKSTRCAEETAELLASGAIVGWFQGRSEFGQRALGNRSILADPRAVEMRDRVNSAVKFREAFRPFAPAVTEEAMDRYFVSDGNPVYYMERVCPATSEARQSVPAVVHQDGSARVQTVTRETNATFYGLLEAFGALTGIPVLMNTSFNVQGEPIVERPLDAVRTFYSTGLDALVIGPFILQKSTT
ncbi:MAG: hypothetical protein CME19_18140 [Gemmatimonadetes bacterium]|nr:hypothetical protein [Gemmatimonadota bacterium]